MLSTLFTSDDERDNAPKEGDLYKEVTIGGQVFRLVYGYYEEFEKESSFNEPMPIYPDLIREPVFTAGGIPIVTAMQDACEKYQGLSEGESCSECLFFQKEEELFGLCTCHERKNKTKILKLHQGENQL